MVTQNSVNEAGLIFRAVWSDKIQTQITPAFGAYVIPPVKVCTMVL